MNEQNPRTLQMQPRVNVITLGVENLERSLAFYRDGLGLQSAGIIGTEFAGAERTPGGAAAMFELDNGVTLALYGREDLAPYAASLRARLGEGRKGPALPVPAGLMAAAGRRLFRSRWFARRVVLDRWFLHAHQPSLPAPETPACA